MPCGPCAGPALQAYLAVQSYATSHPGKVLFYMVDDYANTTCSLLYGWSNSSGMGNADAYFSDSQISMSDYGQNGMPKVVVVGCTEHKVYYNENYTADGITEAIEEAIAECDSFSTSVDKFNGSENKLQLFPNPANNMFNVSYELTEADNVTVDVANMVGKTIHHVSNSKQSAGLVEIQINTEQFRNGFYFLKVETSKGLQVVKFSVVH